MIKIIVVDDHILFREGLKTVLTWDPGFEVLGLAGTVREATELVLSLRPDVVLMDFSLPDGSGVEATNKILAEYPQCKVIFMTTSEKEADLFTAAHDGALGFISKNIPASGLVDAIRAVYHGKNVQQPTLPMRAMRSAPFSKSSKTLHVPNWKN